MTNPSPRPALRKARDAEVHPAAPQAVRPARAAAPTPSREAAPPPAPPKRKRTPATVPADVMTAPVRRFSGTTSDSVRNEADALEHIVPIRPKSSKGERKDDSKPRDLMKGKAVALDVTVPKELQKAAKKRAKADGLDLDTVVIDLLHSWVTRPR